jgi:hypothetical protein
MIAKTQKVNVEQVVALLDNLSLMKNKLTSSEIVGLIKEIVPEYISNNSKFEKLDKIS